MEPGMSFSQMNDYKSILKTHLLPYFGKMPCSEFWSPFQMKKFIAQLKTKKTRYKTPLSGKRIQNTMIHLRVTVRDAVDEYGWGSLHDPFAKLRLPKARKIRIYPFSFDEWMTLKKSFSDWYKPYFEFAVQTVLKPSEQVAPKWSAIDAEFIHIELNRVKNRKKTDLKTEESRRRIEIRPSIRKILEDQWEVTKSYNSPYVFLNMKGRAVLQGKAREVWARALKRSGLRYRRMSETRHTFAFWALGAGESPEWVARTLGHVNTFMVYKTYGRYIPNLTRHDGSALEKLYLESTKNKRDTDFLVTIGHNFGHNGQNPHP
jgi:integrase